MRKIVLIGLIVGFGLNGFSAECTLVMKPSDFQLDQELTAQNTSKIFSKMVNKWESSNIFGYANSMFCRAIVTNVDTESVRDCTNELDQLSKEDTNEFDNNSYQVSKNRADAYGIQNISYGYKTSAYAPISEKHLCYLEKKYGNKIISKENIEDAKRLIESRQRRTYKHYLEVASKIGASDDADAIGRVYLDTEYPPLFSEYK